MIANFKIGIPILLTIIYTALIFLTSSFSKGLKIISLSEYSLVNFQLNYQLCLFIIGCLSLFTTYILDKVNFKIYFSCGNINSLVTELKIFGIKEGDRWLRTGLYLSFFIITITGIFIFLQFQDLKFQYRDIYSKIGWIILFSLTNSFSEEMIFRIGIVSPLTGLLSPITIYFISGILFGLPHLAGIPSGIIGALMAGLLGFILAKSVYETQGFFWAWVIHFLTDLLIFGTLILKN